MDHSARLVRTRASSANKVSHTARLRRWRQTGHPAGLLALVTSRVFSQVGQLGARPTPMETQHPGFHWRDAQPGVTQGPVAPDPQLFHHRVNRLQHIGCRQLLDMFNHFQNSQHVPVFSQPQPR